MSIPKQCLHEELFAQGGEASEGHSKTSHCDRPNANCHRLSVAPRSLRQCPNGFENVVNHQPLKTIMRQFVQKALAEFG